MSTLERLLANAVDLAWGPPLVLLLVGGGFYLTLLSRGLPFFGMRHALAILRGRYDRAEDPGQLSHFQALSTALASTIGLGNIGGVAIAITQGGPGAVFWMWLAALLGMATKFFTCTLAVLYRKEDSLGRLQGGPMYALELGLGPRFRPLALFFAACGMVGCLALFQANQAAGILEQSFAVPRALTGAVAVVLVALVGLGGIERTGRVAGRLVPAMCVLYLLSALLILARNASVLPTVLAQIFHDAFTGTAAAGGLAGIGVAEVIRVGVQRAAFSNEAGIGTAPLAHGAARTQEPVREGLVAMLGPFIDTVLISSLTAMVILSSGLWRDVDGVAGVTLTVQAFEAALGPTGRFLLVMAAALFGFSTMIGYAYYGRKCFAYIFSPRFERLYDVFYLVMLFVGAVWSVGMVVNLMDTAFALMAVPNMVAALLLAPKVMSAARDYFRRQGVALGGVGPSRREPR